MTNVVAEMETSNVVEDDCASDSDSGSEGGFDFLNVDMSKVDFDKEDDFGVEWNEKLQVVGALEKSIPFGQEQSEDSKESLEEILPEEVLELYQCLLSGEYANALRGRSAKKIFDDLNSHDETVAKTIRKHLLSKLSSFVDFLEVELLGIAALNLFLQLNYTGPSLEDDTVVEGDKDQHKSQDPLGEINPHPCFRHMLHKEADLTSKPDLASTSATEEKSEQQLQPITDTEKTTKYHNAVLAELAVDGEWPCQVCEYPYFLLLARSIFLTISQPTQLDWTHASTTNLLDGGAPDNHLTNDVVVNDVPIHIAQYSSKLSAAQLWSARAAVAHGRLLQWQSPPVTLWNEVQSTFQSCIKEFCSSVPVDKMDSPGDWEDRRRAATVMLEWGLAQHHFDQAAVAKKAFETAMEFSGLLVDVTGAKGKRTKFQQTHVSQLLVQATSASIDKDEKNKHKGIIDTKRVLHSEEEILLERIKFEDEEKNEISQLRILDQAILLSLCLDVKNNNPADGLTGEQMGAYLARVLDHHDDWMVYSTALLERSWLEFESTHGRERSILQIQALVDQHTNRLTLTQSTKQSIEDSMPVQERIKNLHSIVYPPRWAITKDLANRYAGLGIVMSAAELFTNIELWDEVVECYRRAGRESKAITIVKEQLEKQETPRMWAALGNLTNEPEYHEKAIALSRGKFSASYIALGQHFFDNNELIKSEENYVKAVEIRPLSPLVWFRLGTIYMRLDKWDEALKAFSQVVQQNPEEHDAWANVAAIHMRNKKPSEAYPALGESLRYNRNNWRIWWSKLYVCLDLRKYDEAIHCCTSILDLKASKGVSDGVPDIEEKCIRAIVTGTLRSFHSSKDNPIQLDTCRRTLSRVSTLLDRLRSNSVPEPWLFEVIAMFHEQMGNDKVMVENLMKEYRALQAYSLWETDDAQVNKVCQVVTQISQIQARDGTRGSLVKNRFLVSGVVKQVRKARLDETKVPPAILNLEKLLQDIEAKLQEIKK